jgi:N-acetylmuramoyl-L-alanine amidase
MRFFAAAILILLCLCEIAGIEATSRSTQTSQKTEDYLRLQPWAQRQGLQVAWTRFEEELQLTNRWTQVSLKVGSQRAELNGITVFLSFPIILRDGAALIAEKDASLTLGPILNPQKARPGEKIKVIALGAGHGGKDTGFRAGEQQEKAYTLLLAREIQGLLTEAGLRSALIRNADRYVALEERPRIAQRAKADLYVELHYNSAGSGNSTARGVEVYCLTPGGASSTNSGGQAPADPAPGNHNDHQNVLLAYHIQRRLVHDLQANDRGVRRARFAVLRDSEMPAVLVEAGFMSEPEELRKILDPSHRRKTAQAIVNGILAYRRLVEQ